MKSIEIYDVRIIQRDFQGQIKDDFHATVTRRSDKSQLIFISDWNWFLKWKVRRKALDRAFRRYDRHRKKTTRVEQFTR